MARKTVFTPASIDAMISGSISDPETRGLSLDVLPSGKKRWRFRRQVAGTPVVATLFGGLFPTRTIADAREWARALNEQVQAGIDPREAIREEKARTSMSVARAHELYMVAVKEGRSSRAKRPNKPRTVKEKQEIYNRDIGPKLGNRSVYEVTERDLILLVEAKGKTAKIRANRLAAELKVFFGWAASLRGLEVGLQADPSRRLGDLRFPETARSRKLSLQELEWFLKGLADEPRHFQRGMLLWLLTAARISEVAQAKSAEVVDGVWTIPSDRSKNSFEHTIALGPWGRSLMESDHEWIFPGERVGGPRNNSVWYKARDRVWARMEKFAGHPIERFTPHDFRRTVRSNTKRLKVDFDTAEAMLNHVKKGLERTYDLYEMDEEKRAWFLKWEQEIAGIARRAGVAEALGVPARHGGHGPASISMTVKLPQSAGGKPAVDVGAPETRARPVLARTTAQFVLSGKSSRPPLAQSINLPPRKPSEPGKLFHRDKLR